MSLKHNYKGLKRALVQEHGMRTRQHADQGYGRRGHLVSRLPIANLETISKYEFDHRTCAGRNWKGHQWVPTAHLYLYVELDERPQGCSRDLEVNWEHAVREIYTGSQPGCRFFTSRLRAGLPKLSSPQKTFVSHAQL